MAVTEDSSGSGGSSATLQDGREGGDEGRAVREVCGQRQRQQQPWARARKCGLVLHLPTPEQQLQARACTHQSRRAAGSVPAGSPPAASAADASALRLSAGMEADAARVSTMRARSPLQGRTWAGAGAGRRNGGRTSVNGTSHSINLEQRG